ncbi:MAG: hypothetical protein EP298_00055 [Gammaproteobacteria bacterium]|nr:MAG: hypothetical protein EP298_00055 [Gammaproteobacteria bacterium]UTW41585.1 DUF5617 domain-containing protein [bacterium SCSIO 12844]
MSDPKEKKKSKFNNLRLPLVSNIFSYIDMEDQFPNSRTRHAFLKSDSKVKDEYAELLKIYPYKKDDELSQSITKVFIRFHQAKRYHNDNKNITDIENILFIDLSKVNNYNKKPIIDKIPKIIEYIPNKIQYNIVNKYLLYIKNPRKNQLLELDDPLACTSDPFGCKRRAIAFDEFTSFGEEKHEFLEKLEKKVLPYCNLVTLSKLRTDLENASTSKEFNAFSRICQRRVNDYDYSDTEYKKTSSYDKAKKLIEDKIKLLSNSDYSKIKKYESIFFQAENKVEKNGIEKLLQDYVNEGTGCNKFFKNKHHTEAVKKFIENNKGEKDIKKYLDELKIFRNRLQNLNSKGALNRRIEFIFQSSSLEQVKTNDENLQIDY